MRDDIKEKMIQHAYANEELSSPEVARQLRPDAAKVELTCPPKIGLVVFWSGYQVFDVLEAGEFRAMLKKIVYRVPHTLIALLA